MFKVVYKLKLQPRIKMNATFHVSILKPFKENILWLDRKEVIRPPPNLVRDHLEYKVEGILTCTDPK
jgi:hypothetical protein